MELSPEERADNVRMAITFGHSLDSDAAKVLTKALEDAEREVKELDDINTKLGSQILDLMVERDEALAEAGRYKEALQAFPGLGSTFWTDEGAESCAFCRGYRPDEDPQKVFQHERDCPMSQADRALEPRDG